MFLSKRNGVYYIFYDSLDSGKRTAKSTKTKNFVKATKFLAEFQKEYERQKEGGVTSVSLIGFMESFLNQKKKLRYS